MKQLIYISLLFIFLSCSTSYDQRLQEVEVLISKRPASALTLIESMNIEDFHDSDSRALYALLLTQARSKNHIKETDMSLVTTAINQFRISGDRYHLMLALYYSGELFYNNHNYNNSLFDLTQAMDIATELDDKFWIAMSAHIISKIYDDNYHYSEAIDFSKIALKNFKLTHCQPYINYAILDLAKSYLGAHLYLSTINLSKQLVDSAEKYNDQYLKYETIRLLGMTLINKKEYVSAIQCYQEVINSSYVEPSDSLYLYYANIKNGFTDSAVTILKKYPSNDYLNTWLRYNAYLAIDSTQQALVTLNDFALHTDSMLRKIKTQNLSSAITEFHNNKALINKANLRASKITNISILCFSLLIIIIISLFTLSYQRKQQSIIKHNVQVAQNLKEIIKVNNDQSRSTIQTLFADRFEILDNLCKILYENPSKLASKKVSTEIDNIIAQFSKNTSKLTTLEKHINLHHENILIHLKHDMPEIKDADYRFMIYSLLGFSNAAIALFLEEDKITAVYDRRKRLKAKFKNLNSEYSEIYLNALS